MKKKSSVMKNFIDTAIRENLNIIVSHLEDDCSCDSYGRPVSQTKACIMIFDERAGKQISIPIKNITQLETVKFRRNSPHPSRGHRRRSTRKQFSYKKWWKDDNVQEDTDSGYR